MYALVRFLDDHDAHVRHVISVTDIQDFYPVNTTDFDNKAVYTAFWSDGEDDNTGYYSVQILALGITKEDVQDPPKRVPVPKVTVEQSSDDETVTQKKRQAAKKKKINRSAGKKDSYARILKNHLSQAQERNGSTTRCNNGRTRKRASSSSDSDESLISSNELQAAKKEASFWQEKCRELREDKIFLQGQVKGFQELLSSKIFKLEEEPSTSTCVKNSLHSAYPGIRSLMNIKSTSIGLALFHRIAA